MRKETLLIEIGTEELPPKALHSLSDAFKGAMEKALTDKKLSFSAIEAYATPRRLALVIHDLPAQQEDYTNERRGPAVAAAMKEGKPTPALMGFARSCGAEIDDLTIQETDKGAWYTFSQAVKGKTLTEMLPEMVEQSLKALPIPKRMRWADNDFEFVRPVRWLVVLYGSDVIDMELFGIQAGNQTRGHRFHTKAPITITSPEKYAEIMVNEAHVMPDFEARKTLISKQILEVTEGVGKAIVSEGLLNEVTALVEWPVALVGSFEEHFLNVPQEALIIAMEEHQRYFPIVDEAGKLLNKFCFITNIESKSPEAVIDGNERVIRPRFADAEFFWEEDKKIPLDAYLKSLESVVFQTKLGTQADKIRRVQTLALFIADKIGADKTIVERAARLNKSDLISNMVQEFPELQGTMARYYAEVQGEPALVASSLEQVYWPRFAGDKLPESDEAVALGLAERLDTIVGIFSIGEIPTGSRDPYSLRRNALAVLRMMVEEKHHLDLLELIEKAAELMPESIDANKSIDVIFNYIFDRMRAYSSDLGVSNDIFASIAELKLTDPLDIYERLLAVKEFKALPAAKALVESNKRIHNILHKNAVSIDTPVNATLLENAEEKALYEIIASLNETVKTYVENDQYHEILTTLANLAEPLEAFFAETMVMVDDEALRTNRLALLSATNELFRSVADISELQL